MDEMTDRLFALSFKRSCIRVSSVELSAFVDALPFHLTVVITNLKAVSAFNPLFYRIHGSERSLHFFQGCVYVEIMNFRAEQMAYTDTTTFDQSLSAFSHWSLLVIPYEQVWQYGVTYP